jgi:hypothetical protein
MEQLERMEQSATWRGFAVTYMCRVFVGGLYVMGAVALGAAIWSPVATAAAVAFVGSAVLVGCGALAAAARWVRGELAWRRELRETSVPATRVGVPAVAVPALSQLRRSA